MLFAKPKGLAPLGTVQTLHGSCGLSDGGEDRQWYAGNIVPAERTTARDNRFCAALQRSCAGESPVLCGGVPGNITMQHPLRYGD